MAQLNMRGVSGRRGPLKPAMDFRIKLALWFLIPIPVAAAAMSLVSVWFNKGEIAGDFPRYWLGYTSVLWGINFGGVAGNRLAAAVGYRGTVLIGRLLELVVPLSLLALCCVASAILYPPNGAVAPAVGTGLFLVTGVWGFVGRLAAK